MKPFVLGIDPGLSGAYALVDLSGALITVDDVPITGLGKQRQIDGVMLADRLRNLPIEKAVVEVVHAMPKQGVSSTFRFGYAAGQVRGVLEALSIPILWATARQWKGSLGLSSDKKDSVAMACEAWPERAVLFSRAKDHGRAEASLIARYGVPYVGLGLTERAA